MTTAVTGASLKEIFFEINRLRAEPPSEEELESAKNYMLGTFVLRNSDRFGILAQLEFTRFHGLPGDYLNTYVGKVRAVTEIITSAITLTFGVGLLLATGKVAWGALQLGHSAGTFAWLPLFAVVVVIPLGALLHSAEMVITICRQFSALKGKPGAGEKAVPVLLEETL